MPQAGIADDNEFKKYCRALCANDVYTAKRLIKKESVRHGLLVHSNLEIQSVTKKPTFVERIVYTLFIRTSHVPRITQPINNTQIAKAAISMLGGDYQAQCAAETSPINTELFLKALNNIHALIGISISRKSTNNDSIQPLIDFTYSIICTDILAILKSISPDSERYQQLQETLHKILKSAFTRLSIQLLNHNKTVPPLFNLLEIFYKSDIGGQTLAMYDNELLYSSIDSFFSTAQHPNALTVAIPTITETNTDIYLPFLIRRLLKAEAVCELFAAKDIEYHLRILPLLTALPSLTGIDIILKRSEILTILASRAEQEHTRALIFELCNLATRFNYQPILSALFNHKTIFSIITSSSDYVPKAPVCYAYQDNIDTSNVLFNCEVFIQVIEQPLVFANVLRKIPVSGWRSHISYADIQDRLIFKDNIGKSTKDIQQETIEFKVQARSARSLSSNLIALYVQYMLVKLFRDGDESTVEKLSEPQIAIYYQIIRFLLLNHSYWDLTEDNYIPSMLRILHGEHQHATQSAILRLLSYKRIRDFFITSELDLQKSPATQENSIYALITESPHRSDVIKIAAMPIFSECIPADFQQTIMGILCGNPNISKTVLDPRNVAQFIGYDESAMRAMTEAEKKMLKDAKVLYEPKIKEAGSDPILDELRTYILTQYKAAPAKYEDKALPVEWKDMQQMCYQNKWWKEKYTAVLQEYYSNSWHTALRYLSQPNYWLSPKAIHTEQINIWIPLIRPARYVAASYIYNKDMIALCWLAVCDESFGFIYGIDDIEGRKKFFIDVGLCNLARAHNCDSRYDTVAKKSTTADDKLADNPACVPGTIRNLAESVASQLFSNIITPERVADRIYDCIRSHFEEQLNQLPRSCADPTVLSLQKIQDLIFDFDKSDNLILDPSRITHEPTKSLFEKLLALNISREQKAKIMLDLHKHFGLQAKYLNISEIFAKYWPNDLKNHMDSEFIFFMEACRLQSLFEKIYNKAEKPVLKPG